MIRGCALEVGVEEGVVALAAPPEHIVFSAQPQRRIHRRLHLRRSVRMHARVRACSKHFPIQIAAPPATRSEDPHGSTLQWGNESIKLNKTSGRAMHKGRNDLSGRVISLCDLTSCMLSTTTAGMMWGTLVAAPCMKRGCLKSCAVPHSTFLPVSFCRCSASSTTLSSMALLSARLAPSGAMSLRSRCVNFPSRQPQAQVRPCAHCLVAQHLCSNIWGLESWGYNMQGGSLMAI